MISFDKDGKVRRQGLQEDFCNELAHLHRLGDKAVALCRTPDLTFYIFSLPECKLEKSLRILFESEDLSLREKDSLQDTDIEYLIGFI